MSSSYEEHILKILLAEKVNFTREKTFSDCNKGKFRYDFYIENHCGRKIAIEVNGEQHYRKIDHYQPKWNGLLHQKENDRKKIEYCLTKDIDIYILPYWDIKKIKTVSEILSDKYRAKSKWHNDIQIVPKK